MVTIVLLPATVLAGIMGMTFKVGIFNRVWMFCILVTAMLAVAVLVLSVARGRRWI